MRAMEHTRHARFDLNLTELTELTDIVVLGAPLVIARA
jgi:hypothetical protein